MKRILKAILRPFWRLTQPVRRRVRAGIEQLFQGCIDRSLANAGLDHRVGARLDEVILVLDSLLLEVARLELLVEELKHQGDATHDSPGDLRKVG